MRYFNHFDLIYGVVTNKINFDKHLKRIRKEEVIKNLMKKNATLLNKDFIITDEIMEEENFAKLPQNVKDKLNKIIIALKKPANKDIVENCLKILSELKKNYPNVPVIYNLIISAYTLLGDEEKQYQTIIEIRAQFPDYLFGKTALCEHYLQNKMEDKIPDVLDNKLEIYLCAPRASNIYHVSEVRSFYSVMGRYYAFKNKIDHALFCYILLKDMDECHPLTELLGKYIVLQELKNIFKIQKK
ncbi:MAG: hypothetical protein BWK75_02615 [Candidatus Altiarchaeales archaeon A3]|nr:MAG: hypothetical protein BWK75_02615 [Candidatus Altiarchaeales archaeon A3]